MLGVHFSLEGEGGIHWHSQQCFRPLLERFRLELLLDHSVVFLDARRNLTLTVLLSNKAPVHWVDKAFHWINSRLVDSRVHFVDTYQLGSN